MVEGEAGSSLRQLVGPLTGFGFSALFVGIVTMGLLFSVDEVLALWAAGCERAAILLAMETGGIVVGNAVWAFFIGLECFKIWERHQVRTRFARWCVTPEGLLGNGSRCSSKIAWEQVPIRWTRYFPDAPVIRGMADRARGQGGRWVYVETMRRVYGVILVLGVVFIWGAWLTLGWLGLLLMVLVIGPMGVMLMELDREHRERRAAGARAVAELGW